MNIGGRFTLRRIPLLRITQLFASVGSVAALTASPAALAQMDDPFQSSARPFGLSIVDNVKQAGSDTASAAFKNNDLVSLRKLAMQNLPEGKPLSDKTVGLHRVNPEQLYLQNAADVRCYFVGEGAGYHNTLGFNTQGGGVSSGNPQLIFPDASSSVNFMNPSTVTGSRSASEPLLPGDFVNLGKMAAQTKLNFFNVSNGANGNRDVYSTDHSLNADRLVHAIAYTLPGSPYLLIGFEDLYGGGDRDYNDLMFTLDIGRANVDYLSGPEPATWASLAALLALVAWRKRRSNYPLSGRGEN